MSIIWWIIKHTVVKNSVKSLPASFNQGMLKVQWVKPLDNIV